jgi:two-component system sensor histidine kinase AtoS
MVLMTNALEATPPGGTVTIRTSSGNDHHAMGVQIMIEDQGEGIPEENRARAFEPFFTTKPHGTGIGLPLAKKFVEINGGKIALMTGAGPGTKVEISLPAAIQ